MTNNFILTTTSSIEVCPIVEYIDVINANVVLGTHIFSDIAASFTDFFGGRSDTYQDKIDKMYAIVKQNIIEKAKMRGANCALNFRVDFDEIGGKGKSMFMINATATIAKAEL